MFGNNKLNETQRAPVIWQRGSVMGALSHLQIVEIGSAAAASYCARLFADFGATVQKVEPPQGDPLRRTAPHTPNGQSAWFAFLNFNKSSVALNPTDESASLRLTELIGDCDILIDGRDIDAADCPAFDLAALKRSNRGLIHVEASWFGREGPYGNFEATDSTIRALTGLVKLVGPVEGPPVHAPDFQTGILASLWGFISASSSALSRMQDGHGRASKLSIFESSIAVSEYIIFEAFLRGDITLEREKYYKAKVAELYANGKATSIASVLEIDEVIDPAETRRWIMAGLQSVPKPEPRSHRKRPCIDAW